MKQCAYSQTLVDSLFCSAYFIDKFQQLQLQTYQDLLQAQHISQSKNLTLQDQQKQTNSVNGSAQKNNRMIEIDTISTEISDLIIMNFKEAIFKQTNPFYQQKINLININQQIQSIKQAISKMSQATSFIGKSLPTQQSITPQKYDLPKEVKGKNKNQDKETSMFMHEDQESSIQLGFSRKNLTEDRIANFSFMNSFLNQNKISPQEEQIINQRINASISKIESSIDDRISQLQKEFTRRIQQIMKTIKHLIQMMNQNQRVDTTSPPKKIKKNPIGQAEVSNIQTNTNFKKNTEVQKTVSSKSTIVTSKNVKQPTSIKRIDEIENQKGKIVLSPQISDKQKSLNSSSSKLASFFGLGRLKTEH